MRLIKLLAVSGSPVDDSSTDILLKMIAEKIIEQLDGKESVELHFVKLNDLEYKSCQACGEAPRDSFCFFDDLNDTYKLLEQCDCLLFGSPVYFDTVSAQAKLFIDRCNCFRPADFENIDPEHMFIKKLTRKRPGAIVLVGGENGWFEGARRVIAGFFKWVEVINSGQVFHASKDFCRKGTCLDDDKVMNEADDIALKLTNLILEKGHTS